MKRASLNEAALLAKVAKGDQQAFKQLYDQYFPMVFSFGLRILHVRALAQETAQEVMLAFWQKGSELADIRNLEAFLKTLTKRKTIDAWRRLQLARRAEAALKVDWSEADISTDTHLFIKDVNHILEKGIDRLPPRQRSVYRLCQQQGLKYDEAARRLNISPATVHTHMKLALKSLRSYLQHHADLTVLFIIFQIN